MSSERNEVIKMLKSSGLPTDAKYYRERAEYYLQQGRPDGAVNDLTLALVLDPNDSFCRNALVNVQTKKLEKLMSNKRWVLHMKQAKRYEDEGKLSQAVKEYEKASRIDPFFFKPYQSLESVYKKMGNTEKMEEMYGSSRYYNPSPILEVESDEVLAREGIAVKAQEPELAPTESVAKEAHEPPGDLAVQHMSLGKVLVAQGKLSEATKELQAAIKAKPDWAEAHFNLGLAYRMKGELDDAVKEYKLAIQLKPNFPDAYINLASVYAARGRPDDALTELRRALEKDPENALAYYNIGVVCEKLNSPEEAIKAYQLAVRYKPYDAKAHSNLGAVYMKLSKLEDAVRELQTAVKYDPTDHIAHFNLGLIHANERNFEEAMNELQLAIKHRPDFAQAKRVLENIQRAYRGS